VLRQSKLALTDQVAGAGLKFHGQSVRGRRKPTIRERDDLCSNPLYIRSRSPWNRQET
jgi:hypothetical protein